MDIPQDPSLFRSIAKMYMISQTL
uniref:Uncharacterized protein n=1 Tax=Arundo donax TaxID=35708 RepID=A0A0A9EM16_ARUDO